MQHSSKTRTWANDDDIPAATVPPEPAVVETQDINQDKPARPLKKSKVIEAETPSQASKPPAVQSIVDTEEIQRVNSDKTEEDAPDEDQPKSDMDWLRSKTSRLLGLLDEEEQADSGSPPPAPDTQTVEPIEEDSDEVEETLPAEIPVAEEPTEEKDYNADIEHIRISGRLFLRNLAYDATEADLETIFAPFGKIDEVSLLIFIHSVVQLKIVARVMIILIGTSDMQCIRDVNRKSILVDAS